MRSRKNGNAGDELQPAMLQAVTLLQKEKSKKCEIKRVLGFDLSGDRLVMW